jgi:protein-S-isoprenylcysteine O-methyltransferase Ste14
MTVENIFRILSFSLVAAAITISGYYRRKAELEAGELDKSEGQGLLVLLRAFALFVLVPLVGYWLNPDWVAWARFSLPDWTRWFGALFAAGLLPMFLWIFRNIGNNISPTQTTRANHNLVTTGPYRFIRHPLYSCGFIFFLAISILTSLWWLAAGLTLGMILILIRTPKEEARLLATFGEAYATYMAQTGRFFPKLRRNKPFF